MGEPHRALLDEYGDPRLGSPPMTAIVFRLNVECCIFILDYV